MIWDPNVDDLAAFTGEVGASYEPFVQSALTQATVLYEFAACPAELPAADTKEGQLVRNAILAMADALYLGRGYRAAKATPFQSESIGSYSYSKAQQAVSNNLPTGVGWFDMAVEYLGACATSKGTVIGSAKTFFEDDIAWHTHLDGRVHLLGPEDLASPTPPGWYVSTPRNPRSI